MDFQVMTLDQAYLTSEDFNQEVYTKTQYFSEELRRIIENLKIHWISSAATRHINNLIDEYNRNNIYFSELNKASKCLQNYFVTLQTCRARMSDNKKVGTKTKNKFDFDLIELVDTTDQYYFDDAMQQDYNDLEELYNQYTKFAETVDTNFEEIFSNWKEGRGRKEFLKFREDSTYTSKKLLNNLLEVKETLQEALINCQSLGHL